MAIDEGLAVRNGESLNVQCILRKGKKITGMNKERYHFHRYIEFLYVLDGKILAAVGETEYVLKDADLMIIYPGEIHRTLFLEDAEFIVVKFLPDILYSFGQTSSAFEYMFNFSADRVGASRIISQNAEIDRLLKNAMQTFLDKGYADELFVRADITKVCAEILKIRKENNEIISVESSISRENLMLLQKTMQVVKETNGNLKTHEAALLCNLSDGYFSRLFRTVMNMPFTKYVKSVKLAEGERLLICTTDSVSSIAQALNYVSTSHFIEDFRKTKGISPKQYRNKYTKNV